MNLSTAVRQQRHEPHDSLDDFPTPPWATRALCEWMKRKDMLRSHHSVREPTANRGHMVGPLREYFDCVDASDVYDYGAGFSVRDYLFGEDPEKVSWTIFNAPFRLNEEFILRALRTSEQGVAAFARTAFLEGIGRHDRLFTKHPPTDILQFAERVVIHKGRLAPRGSTATSYCWLVWDFYSSATRFAWIPPCRSQLEHPSDYEAAA